MSQPINWSWICWAVYRVEVALLAVWLSWWVVEMTR